MSTPMPGCEVWDLVKVPFPYKDRPVQQRRPALVVAIPDTSEASALLWVLMVTSLANRGWPGDVVISDFEAAGLPAASVVRVAKIATIEAREAEAIGTLGLPEQGKVAETLRGCLGVVLSGGP